MLEQTVRRAGAPTPPDPGQGSPARFSRDGRSGRTSWAGAVANSSLLPLLVVLILLTVIFAVINENFLTLRNLSILGNSVAMTGIVATAMTLVIIGGNLDLSVASNMALTSVVVANLLMYFQFSQPVAVLAGLVLGIVLGMFNAVLIARVGINAVIVTLAAFNVFRNGAYLMGNKGGQAIPIAFADTNSFFNFIGQGDVAGVPTPLILMVIVFLAIWFLLDRTRFGREIYAVGGNQRAARFSGISVSSYTFVIFVLTGFVSAISGVIYASRLAGGYPMAAQGWELDIITAVFLGGTSLTGGEGSIVGTLIGVLILGVLRNGLSLAGVETSAQYMVTGAVLLVAVLYDSIRRRREAA